VDPETDAAAKAEGSWLRRGRNGARRKRHWDRARIQLGPKGELTCRDVEMIKGDY
jgi:hypothetical protein